MEYAFRTLFLMHSRTRHHLTWGPLPLGELWLMWLLAVLLVRMIQGNYKAADKVYVRGLDAMVDREAKSALEHRRQQFQTRVARRMKGELIPAEEVEEQEQRTALGRLQGHGRHGTIVGSIRVGSVKLGGPGTLPASAPFREPLKPTNNKVGIQIYQDENAPPRGGLPAGGLPVAGTIPTRKDHKENELAAGKWSQQAKAKGT